VEDLQPRPQVPRARSLPGLLAALASEETLAMLYAVRFHDRTDRLATRERCLAAHIAWLAERRDRVLVAGSLRPEPGSAPVGGLWIVEADSRADVEAIYATDPFWTEGLRERVEIFFWSKALPGRVPV
jgi:hypothetical protein